MKYRTETFDAIQIKELFLMATKNFFDKISVVNLRSIKQAEKKKIKQKKKYPSSRSVCILTNNTL